MPEQRDESQILQDTTIVFTGTLSISPRRKAAQAAKSAGATVSNHVSLGTDYLVVGAKPGSKLARAREIGVNIINEDEFKKLLNGEILPDIEPRKARVLARQRLILEGGFNIPIEDSDITDLRHQNLSASCSCGQEFKRIMKRGRRYAWACDGEQEECRTRRYALHRVGYGLATDG